MDQKTVCCKICGLLLAAVIVLTACMGKAPKDSMDGGSVAENGKAAESISEMDRQLEKLTDRMFTEMVSSSILNLHFILSDPQEYGVEDIPKDFGSLSGEDIRQDYQDLHRYQDSLKEIDRASLSRENQLLWDILSCYLKTELQQEPFYLYYQPLTPYTGEQAELPMVLAEYKFNCRQDIEDYLALLSQMDEYFTQVLAFEKERAQAGLLLSDNAIDGIVDSCRSYLSSPETGVLAKTFEERLEHVPGLSEEERDGYIAQNQEVLSGDFRDAYQQLANGLVQMKGGISDDRGVCYLPDGKDYYWRLVQSSTYTSLESPEALKQAIEQQIYQDLLERNKLIYEDASLMERMGSYQFTLTEPYAILEDLREKMQKDFPPLPECEYHIEPVPQALEQMLSPAFYLSPPLDRYREENVIYINGGLVLPEKELYTTLAHEGFPGHLYQTVYFYSQEPNKLRAILPLGSYQEGWATYVEYASYHYDEGLEEGLASALARNDSAILGFYALLDYYIHYEGWDRTQVAAFAQEEYHLSDGEMLDTLYSTIAQSPAYYMEYYLGYWEILQLKKEAQQTLGQEFDLQDFHTFLLEIGPAPFSVIRRYLSSWLKMQTAA